MKRLVIVFLLCACGDDDSNTTIGDQDAAANDATANAATNDDTITLTYSIVGADPSGFEFCHQDSSVCEVTDDNGMLQIQLPKNTELVLHGNKEDHVPILRHFGTVDIDMDVEEIVGFMTTENFELNVEGAGVTLDWDKGMAACLAGGGISATLEPESGERYYLKEDANPVDPLSPFKPEAALTGEEASTVDWSGDGLVGAGVGFYNVEPGEYQVLYGDNCNTAVGDSGDWGWAGDTTDQRTLVFEAGYLSWGCFASCMASPTDGDAGP